MEKRGQVTIFIIMAIVIVGAVVIFFIARNMLDLKVYSPEVENIYLFVEDCIEKVGNEVVYEIGLKGGYYFPTNLSISTGIPIYYSDGKNYMPSKEEIENEISYFVNEKLFFCTRNFVDFSDFEITQGEIKTKTTIEEDEVILNVNYPISVTKGESTTVLKEFKNIEIPARLGIVYDSIDEVIKEQLSHESICLSCILDISLKNDLYVDMMDYDDETVIFIFRDENSKINNETFEFVFANKYEAVRE